MINYKFVNDDRTTASIGKSGDIKNMKQDVWYWTK